MVKLSSTQVKHITSLANLALKASEIKKFQDQLTNILDYAGQVEKIKTANITSRGQITLEKNRTREDEIDSERVLPQEETLGQAKGTHNGYFVVDAILEK